MVVTPGTLQMETAETLADESDLPGSTRSTTPSFLHQTAQGMIKFPALIQAHPTASSTARPSTSRAARRFERSSPSKPAQTIDLGDIRIQNP